MTHIDAQGLDYRTLNERIRTTPGDVDLERVLGQRYIGAARKEGTITVHGTPGNALGGLLDGAAIEVYGNTQDATGDTMNDGTITIHGDTGDECGYAMRGGRILIEGSAGYRAGIHMKAYQDKQPLIVIGSWAGSFLGEYQAGGTIIVLGMGTAGLPVGNFTGGGMHGGRIYLCCTSLPPDLPAQVVSRRADGEDKADISRKIDGYCHAFHLDKEALLAKNFYVLSPNSANPYRQLYTYA